MGIFEKNLIFMVVKWILNWLSSNEKNKKAASIEDNEQFMN
jgi:hypothetical protein